MFGFFADTVQQFNAQSGTKLRFTDYAIATVALKRACYDEMIPLRQRIETVADQLLIYILDMALKQARRWFVSGRVQGVGFRYFVQHEARGLQLQGWVRNLEDGRVEVYAMGPADQLDHLASALHKGPRMADVRTVDQQEAAPESVSGFAVR